MAVRLTAMDADFNRAFKRSEKTLGTFTKSVGALSGQLKTLVAGFGAIEIGRQIIQTTSEFQKFAAVLKNSLGSDSEAQRSLQQIKDFAGATPFSVQELTGSFVKLVNQGFRPSMTELRRLGDLAASTGKGFDQLTEALIDAQVGEFERLKEFGIRAQKEGDKVTFTFKGVKTQVDFTSSSIQQYILSLGDAIGVSGSMEKISATLGGRISNLGDAWDNLMVAMGESSGGPLFAVVESLTNITNALSNLGAEMALIGQFFSPFHDLRDVSKETLDYLLKTQDVAASLTPFEGQDFTTFYNNFTKNAEEFRKIFLEQGETIADINILWDHYIKKRVASADADRKAADAAALAAEAARKSAEESDKLARADLQRSITGSGALRKSVTTKTGADFLFDSGALVELANAGANALRTLDTALEVNSNAWDVWWSGVQARSQQAAQAFELHQEKTMKLAEVSETVGTQLGEIFSSIATGQEGLVQSMAGATQAIIEMFLRQSIAAMIASHLKDPKTALFPFAKIAAAAAGIVAVKSLFSGLGASGGGGGSAGVAPGRLPSERVQIGGRIRGYDLALVTEKESYRRSRLG